MQDFKPKEMGKVLLSWASIFCMNLVVFSESRKQKKKTCSLVLSCEKVMFNKWVVKNNQLLAIYPKLYLRDSRWARRPQYQLDGGGTYL